MKEMMITATAFIRGEATAASKKKGHTSWRTHDQSKRQTLEKREITFPPLTTSSGAEGPLVIEAEFGGHMIHRMYVDGGSSIEILYEHYFNRLLPEALGNNRRRLSFHKSMDKFHDSHGMLKFPVDGEIVTIRSTILIPTECATVIRSSEVPKETHVRHENFKVALHSNIPDQEVAIEGTLSAKGRTELCSLLKENLDIYTWQPSDMTGVSRSVAEHRLNIREGYSPVWQKKRGQAPERAKAIQAKVQKLVEAGIMREVYYHDWLSYPVMVKKHDGSWRMQSDEEKMAFHTGQGVYCYTKMPFGLKNAGATYQRLVDKAFDSQIVEGMFLEYMVTPKGIKPCPDKTEAVLKLPSPRTIKEVQSLNGKLASLNRFLSKSAKKSLPLFKTLKKCIKKSNFNWTPEAKQAFKQLKQHLSESPLLVAPKPKEELIVYMSVSYRAISVVLMTKRGMVQTPVYFISRALQGPELDYTPMEKLVLTLVFAAKRLRRMITKMELHDESQLDASVVETQQDPWTLFMDGSSCVDGSGAGLILTSPEGTEFTYALRFQFAASNNEAEYEALIAGLQIIAHMRVRNVHVSVDFKFVANQVLGAYVAKEENVIKYLEKVKSLVSSFTNFSINQVPRSKNKKADALSKIASTSFAHLSKQVLVEIVKEKFIQEKEVTTVVEEDGPTWMTTIMEYLKEGTLPSDRKEARNSTNY
nr:reverse transcriptase domain-containing protein [Tanacetum cinerariifolium]